MTNPIFSTKDHKRLMGGYAEKSMNKTFGPEARARRYPFCMRNKRPAKACKTCGIPREKVTEIIKGKCRRCFQLERTYKDPHLLELAAIRIKLARSLNVRP